MFDDDEDIESAELIANHKKEKLFPDWLRIAFARERLDNKALVEAGFDLDDPRSMYHRNPAYKAAMERLKQLFPGLLTYQPDVCTDLNWLAEHASALDHWPQNYIQIKLTSPNIIRNRYERIESTGKAQ
jgi:hypothetical protein